VAARVTVALVAVVVLSWLGVGLRDARLHANGVAALRASNQPAELRRAERALRRAALLNPDTRPDLDRGLALASQHRFRAAIAVVEDVVRREPDNLVAWGVLSVFARGRDPEALERALAARRRLDPRGARSSLGRYGSASASTMPASTTAGRVTAGSCQSQSIDA